MKSSRLNLYFVKCVKIVEKDIFDDQYFDILNSLV